MFMRVQLGVPADICNLTNHGTRIYTCDYRHIESLFPGEFVSLTKSMHVKKKITFRKSENTVQIAKMRSLEPIEVGGLFVEVFLPLTLLSLSMGHSDILYYLQTPPAF